MLELILAHAVDASQKDGLRQAIAGHIADVRASAGRGDRDQVAQAEAAVRADPEGAFALDGSGSATLKIPGRDLVAGRFVPLSITELKDQAQARRQDPVRQLGAAEPSARVRLWVFDGARPATDIGSLQATAGRGTVFQVASQFNCLESPGPYVTRVTDYFSDPTQGPRAPISPFPAALLRTYAAPGPGRERFVQRTDERQIEHLAGACGPGVAPKGCRHRPRDRGAPHRPCPVRGHPSVRPLGPGGNPALSALLLRYCVKWPFHPLRRAQHD
jgi:hypothetical protein